MADETPAGPIVGLSREDYQKLLADQTPNVVLENPKVRKVLNYVLGITALALPIITFIDQAADSFDWSEGLGVANQIALFLTGALAVGVTARNVPSR